MEGVLVLGLHIIRNFVNSVGILQLSTAAPSSQTHKTHVQVDT